MMITLIGIGISLAIMLIGALIARRQRRIANGEAVVGDGHILNWLRNRRKPK